MSQKMFSTMNSTMDTYSKSSEVRIAGDRSNSIEEVIMGDQSEIEWEIPKTYIENIYTPVYTK